MLNKYPAGGTANDPSGGIFTGGGRNSAPGMAYLQGVMTPSDSEVETMMKDPSYRQLFMERKAARMVGNQNPAADRQPAEPIGRAQAGKNPRLAEMQRAKIANSRSVQPEDDKTYETAIDSGNRQISMQVVRVRVPFCFTFCPTDLAGLPVGKAKEQLTFHLQDVLKYYIPNVDRGNSVGKMNDPLAIFEKSWTLSQMVLQDVGNTSYLPMCVRVSIIRPSSVNDISKKQSGLEILPQNTVTGISGELPYTTIIWPTDGVMEKSYTIRPERTKFVRSFLQDRCPTKTVESVCKVLQSVSLVNGQAYKLKSDDPVVVYIIDNAREDAMREMEKSRPAPRNQDEAMSWEQEFKVLFTAKIQEKMQFNEMEDAYYVPTETALGDKAWIVSNANEVITGSDLFPTPGHPASGCTISIWPFVKLSGASNEKSTAAVFDVNNSNFAKVKAISLDASDIADVGKNWYMFHGCLILSFLRPQGQLTF